MTDFVIVIATAVAMAAPVAPNNAAAAAPGAASAAAAATVPLTAPTVGFRTYPDAASCEQAAAVLAAPRGARLVCVPVEAMAGDMANAY